MFCSTNCIKYKEDRCDYESTGFCVRKFKLDYLYDNALITEKQRNHIDLYTDVDGTDLEAFTSLKNIENDVCNFIKEGRNLYIHSLGVGNGKTSWALRIIQSYFNKIWSDSDLECRGLFVYVPRYLLAIKEALSEKSEYVDHIKENILKADLVIFDEIGTKSSTVFENENLLNIISTRIDCGKSNIYTSNLTPEELQEKLGDRLYSRIVNLSTNVELFGKDKRVIAK